MKTGSPLTGTRCLDGFLSPTLKPAALISHPVGVPFNTMNQCTCTGAEPATNWSDAARPLNSASDRLTDECLVPLIHRGND